MQKTLDYLYGLERFGIKLGLEVVGELLRLLGNPQEKFKSIHIAGTNGKGSTANFIYSVLKEARYKVGIYTSPHLVKFNERINVGGEEITDSELVELTKKIKMVVEENDLSPTFFEFTTALMFLYFAEKKVDYAIIETGMGGRLDATNVLHPLVSVITNISLDHTKYLGESKLEIAQEKVAIVKENGILVTSEEDYLVLELFEKVCKEKKAELIVLDNVSDIEIKMFGKHQKKNAALAKKVIEVSGIKVNESDLRKGLLKAKWPGRLQVVNEKPFVILEGAHNVEGMKKLREFLAEYLVETKFEKKILVLGIAKDKEIKKLVDLIVPFFDEIILTKGNFKPAELEVIEKEISKEVIKIEDPKKAVETAISLVEEKGFVLVTGSLYLVGDVLKYIPDFSNLFKKIK